MNLDANQLSLAGRKAVSARQWATVSACARKLLQLNGDSAEGFFLAGLASKAARNGDAAVASLERALKADAGRYDAAIELANLYCAARRNGEAYSLVRSYENRLSNSPVYSHMAGLVYSGIGLPELAWPHFERANRLQPGVDMFQASLATCAVFLGRSDEAIALYRALIERHPTHQRNHYQLSRLLQAENREHIDAMLDVLKRTDQSPDKNVFMYYAIGKEFEDLGEWEQAFTFFRKAGDAVASVARYRLESDLSLIETFMRVCNGDWLATDNASSDEGYLDRRPVFVVGLPRTGTTLVERTIASHSMVQSLGETQFTQMVVRRESGIASEEKITPAMVEAAAQVPIERIGEGYRQMIDYRLGDEPVFVDKLPFNIFYLGFIAKAFPNAGIVVVNRDPMDACFAMYKQVFTWAYKFSYTLDGLAKFYPVYRRLLAHWREQLGTRLIEVDYEDLVADHDGETRRLLAALDLPFEDACLRFNENRTASTTASAVQVREKVHSRSVGRWRRYERQLEPLRAGLANAGIDIS